MEKIGERRTGRSAIFVLLAFAFGGFGATCLTSPDKPQDTAQSGRSLKDSGSLRLPPRSQWLLLNPRETRLFSPAISPDGMWLAASGPGGVGLYVVAADGSFDPELLDADYRGPRAWSGRPMALHFGHGKLRAFHPGKVDLKTGRAIWERGWDEEWGLRLFRNRKGSWYHHPRHGTITYEKEGQQADLVFGDGAWGPAVSPNGERVAFCTGTLEAPRLYLSDGTTGKTVELGAGVHPAWFPDGRRVVYSRPAGVKRFAGEGNVTKAELVLYDLETGTSRTLTSTDDIAEMEPAVSPDGRFVVFSDWHRGVIYRAEVMP